MISELHPPRALGVLVGGGVSLWCFIFSGALLWRGLSEDIGLPVLGIDIASAFFFALGCLFAYWTYGCFSMRYFLDRNGLIIHWGDVRQLVPMDRIEKLIPGRELPPPKISGVTWLGHHVGKGAVEGLGEVLFYATHRTHEELLYVVTGEHTYAISVRDEVRFAEELQGHQKLGQVVSLPQVTERSSVASMPFWYDPMAQLLAVGGIVAFAAMTGYIFYNYPDLQESIPFSFPSLGGITRVDNKSELLSIPVTGIGFLAINLVLGFFLHAWERAVGYLLFLAGIATQIMLLSAAIITLHQ